MMNSFTRSEGQVSSIVADTIAMDRLGSSNIDALWIDRRLAVTNESGLPLTWRGSNPVAAQFSSSRQNQLIIKRLVDVTLSLVALVALMPLFAIVALCILVSSRGPVLFKQQREGLGGQAFSAFKFRSMRVEDGDQSGVTQTVKNDPRVTGIGRFIRKTSIDELPQLLNVLRGDMSLVGPRPHVAGMKAATISYRALVPYYDDRLSMRPGITGWAQANGYRGPTLDAASAIARIRHDVAYVQNFSLWLDAKILVKTVVAEFVTGSGD